MAEMQSKILSWVYVMWELGGLRWFILKNFGILVLVKSRLQEINEGGWW